MSHRLILPVIGMAIALFIAVVTVTVLASVFGPAVHAVQCAQPGYSPEQVSACIDAR